MWRSVCAVVLLPVVALGQSASVAQPPQTVPTLSTRSAAPAKLPPYRPYTFYAQLRQATTEKAVVELEGIPFFETSPRAEVPGIMPLKLELISTDGIEATAFKYPKTYKRKLAFQPQPIPVLMDRSVQFKLRAGKNVALGAHTLSGKLTFQIVSDKGVSAPQEIAVEMPVTVVAHDARVRKAAWPPYYQTNTGLVIALIVLSPILIPLVIPIMIVCGITGDIACD